MSRPVLQDRWASSSSVRGQQIKADIRAKVEHVFRVIKRQFGHLKVATTG